MKIDVPFFASSKDTDCGPLALKMALAYLGINQSFENIAHEEMALKNGLVWSIGIARAAAKFGMPVRFISISNFSMDDDIEFYKKNVDDEAMLILKKIKEDIIKMGIVPEEKNIALEELLSYVNERSIPIVLVNWNVLAAKDGFYGHFLPVTGYDDEYVYVHNPGVADAKPHLKLKRDLFTRAWESKGTDKDTIIVFKDKN